MQIYLVGGVVRDELLGLPVTERDWVVVGATPEEMGRRGFKPVGRHFPVFLHPDTHEEYALARTERKTGPGYHGFEFRADPGVSLEEDLRRRDLTINAIARGDGGELVDPWGGRRDLEKKLLRHVSPAFVEDPVRVLRVARFAARFHPLGFRVAPETMELMRSMVNNGEIEALVPERVWKECETALAEPSPSRFFIVLRDVGALAPFVPGATCGAEAFSDAAVRPLDGCAGAPKTVFAALALQAAARSVDVIGACRRARAPTAYSKLATAAAFCWGRLEYARTLDAQTLLKVFERSGAFRDAETLTMLLDAWRFCDFPQTLGDKTRCLGQIRAALDAVRRLNVRSVVESAGGDIGEAVRRARLDCIESFLRRQEE